MKNKIKISLFVLFAIGIIILGLTNKTKTEVTKTKRKTQDNLAIMIKEQGASDYTKSSSKNIPKGNYTLNYEKSYCKNNGQIGNYNSTLGKVSFSFIGTDSCYLYFDYKAPAAYKTILANTEKYDIVESYNTSFYKTGSGLYQLEDDLGLSSYFRGAVKNNWVKFGNNNSGECKYKGYDILDESENIVTDKETCESTIVCRDPEIGYFVGFNKDECEKWGEWTNEYATFTGKDIYWRIIRINGDYTIRLIYYGTEAPTSDSTYATDNNTRSAFGSSSLSFNGLNKNISKSSYYYPEYSGFQYAIGKQSACGKCKQAGTEECEIDTEKDECKTYLLSLQNSKLFNSTAKIYLEKWWQTTNLNDYYSNGIISDGTFCNDRSVITTNNTGYVVGEWGYNGGGRTLETKYAAYTRLFENRSTSITPTFKCTLNSDKFSVTSKYGNAALIYPVGLITADELVAAGLVGFDSQYDDYFLTTSNIMTMTPFYFHDTASESQPVLQQLSSNQSSMLSILNLTSHGYVYPVINLASDVSFQGSGTWNDPYTIVE